MPRSFLGTTGCTCCFYSQKNINFFANATLVPRSGNEHRLVRGQCTKARRDSQKYCRLVLAANTSAPGPRLGATQKKEIGRRRESCLHSRFPSPAWGTLFLTPGQSLPATPHCVRYGNRELFCAPLRWGWCPISWGNHSPCNLRISISLPLSRGPASGRPPGQKAQCCPDTRGQNCWIHGLDPAGKQPP
jgi:hypothetical protein